MKGFAENPEGRANSGSAEILKAVNLEVLWAIYNFETSVVTCKDRPERGSTTLHRTRALEQHAVRLEQSEEKYRTVFAQANDAIEVVDEDGRFIDCNQKACEMFGYTREELLSKRLWEVVPPEFRDGIRARMTRVMEGGSEPLCEAIGLRKDGTRFAVEVNSGVIELEGRRRIISFVRDITERKRLEEELQQGRKLQALGQLASGVAHDFNNALTVILGRAELLSSAAPDAAASRRDLEIIEKAASAAGKTVKRLQNFARKREDRPRGEVDLNDCLHEAAEMVRPRWKDQAEMNGVVIEVGVDARPRRTVIQGERAELQEAFINLLNNSLDAMPEGGRISLSTEDWAGGVRVCVSDIGKGMTPEERERAFDPFFTTKGDEGLGLSMVYGIVERHGGEITIASEAGAGTSIRLIFPHIAERAGIQDRPDADILPSDGSGRILVIDDEEDVADLVGDLLRLGGYEVAVANDPREGLSRFRSETFDLVLTDLGMPGMMGWQVAWEVKELNSGVPVILITGWAVELDEKQIAESGVALVLEKPVQAKELLHAVRKTLREKGEDSANLIAKDVGSGLTS